jgi:TIR domain-containing protein/tetratricopeptide repeat protein
VQPEQTEAAVAPLFFISHRNVLPDVAWAYWVAWLLEETYGDRCCVIQDWDFDPSGNFIKAMHKGASAAFTIAIVSPNYFTSDHTEDEWTAAFKDRKLVLLETAPCEPPGLLSPLFRLRLYGRSENESREALVQHMQRVISFAENGRLKPALVPDFPGLAETFSPDITIPCNNPHPPVRHFIPPGATWDALKEVLKMPDLPTSRRVCVFHGLHGTGKTQAASAFCWEHCTAYSALLWVRGDSEEVLRASFRALCEVDALDLPEQHERHADKQLVAVKRWLKKHPGWLLIADNIDTEATRDALLRLIPASASGTALVTSCLSEWPPICERIEFHPWHFSLSAAFLLKRLNRPQEDWPILAFIGDLLGGLPIALEQAAAYMEQSRTPVELYLPMLLGNLERELNRQTPGSTDYPASFATVIMESLGPLTPEARFLLELSSFLAPQGQFARIYETIVSQGGRAELEQGGIPCLMSDPESHLAELQRWSLVMRCADEFDIHPLIQKVVKTSLCPVDRDNRLAVLMRLLFAPFASVATPTQSDNWNVWNAVFPHMEAFADELRHGGDRRALGYLLNQMGLFLGGQGLDAQAIALMREGANVAEAEFGPDHRDTAAALCNLAELLISTGQAPEARPLLLRATAMVAKRKPLVPHGQSACWNNLGLCHKALGDHEAAEGAFREAISFDKARNGSDDDFGLVHQNNLANLLSDTERKHEAESIYRNVIAKMRDGVRLSAALTNFGALLYRTERATEAVAILERAAAILSHFFRPEHPEMAKTLLHLAVARKMTAKS